MKENGDIKDDNSTTYDHVIKYTGIFGGVQGITMLMGLVRNKLVALLLGTQGAALINIFNSALKFANDSTNFGVPFSAVKHIAEIHEGGDEEQLKKYACIIRTWTLFTGLTGMLIMISLSHAISYWTFGNYDNTFNFILLAPAITCLSVSGGELAILKGTKHLKKVALAFVFSSITALLLCIPIYYYIGLKGVVLSLLLTNAAVMLIQLHYSTKVLPWRVSMLSRNTYLEGMPMLRLGLGYIIAGVFGQGAEYIIRVLILRWGNLEDVGLYHSGYIMSVTYASMVFIAIETDYFPRLSAIKDNVTKQNATVNQQIEVCSLLISPFLILFVAAMPLIVIILFSSEFSAAVPMAICASFYMFFKAHTLPAAYLSLAHGDSKMFMLTELIYAIFIALAIPLAYRYWGLIGAGFALSTSGLLDTLIIHITYRQRYHFRFSTRLLHFYVLQFLLLAFTVWTAIQPDSWHKFCIEGIAFCISISMSIHILRRKTNLLSKIYERIKARFTRK